MIVTPVSKKIVDSNEYAVNCWCCGNLLEICKVGKNYPFGIICARCENTTLIEYKDFGKDDIPGFF